MRMAPDDGFKLRFPVAKDRTLRRIAIAQLIIVFTSLFSISIFFIAGYFASPGTQINNVVDIIFMLSPIIFFLMFPIFWIVAIIEARVQVRRYGWRVVKDPIEAQRVAMREALYDVATGSTRPDVELEQNGERITVVPVRRLRPAGARLELIAERERAQVPQQGS